MRNINHIIIHCSASQPEVKIQTILNYWKEVKGWNTVGYHYLIEYNGTLNCLLPVSKVSNGVAGNNSDSINVCYIGGVDKNGKAFDTRSEKQKQTLIQIIKKLKIDFPNAQILGHRDFSPDLNKDGVIQPCERIKECPSFEAKEEYKAL